MRPSLFKFNKINHMIGTIHSYALGFREISKFETDEERTGLLSLVPSNPESIKALKEKMFPYSNWFINSDGHKKL